MTPSRRCASWGRIAVRELRRAAVELIEFAAPSRCAGCGADGLGWLCPGCLAGCQPPPGPVCSRCGGPWRAADQGCGRCARFGRPFAFASALGLWTYQGPVQRMVQAFKYDGRRDILAPLGQRLARAARLGALLGPAAELPTVVVPVPARRRARRRRGYDQAVLLGEAFARSRRLGWAPKALRRRRRHERRQAGSSIDRRRRQVRGAFTARPGAVAGRSVLLVDDVMSTGATADAASRALRLAGATRVTVLVLAT